MRAKPLTLLAVAVTGGLALLAGAQTWVSFMLEGTHSLETVVGHDLNAAVAPVSIAIIAAALALSIAGPVFRRVLGALVLLLGVGLITLTAGVITAPLGSVGARITELTGITGTGVRDLVIWYSTSPWVWVSVAAGVLAVLLGLSIVVFGGKWVTGGRKYRAEPRTAGGAPDRISDWDSLSDGADPSDGVDADDSSRDIR